MKKTDPAKPNKNDLILAAVILAAAALAALLIHFNTVRKSSTPAAYVTARVDGEEYGTWDLGTDREIEINTKYGHNVLTIENGEARMTEADCPDGYCMQQKPVSAEHPERTIVCLPHRLVISAKSAEPEDSSDAGVDVVAGR